MKKYTYIPVTIAILLSSVTLVSAMSLPSPYEQEFSRSERLEIYNQYQTIGEAGPLKFYLDPATTSSLEFREALIRLKRVFQLKEMGYPVSGFTNNVIENSEKFREMEKLVLLLPTPIISTQELSTEKRTEFYGKYQMMGYDIFLLTFYLDASTSKTSEYVKAVNKILIRADLKKNGYDVRELTTQLMLDTPGFEKMVLDILKQGTVFQPVPAPVPTTPMPVPTAPDRSTPMPPPVSDRPIVRLPVKELTTAQKNKLIATMKARIAKIPESKKQDVLTQYETKLLKSMELSKKNNKPLLVSRDEVLLNVVRDELNKYDDLEDGDSLFE